MTTAVDVALPPGWFPLGPVPGALLAAVAARPDGCTVAAMVIRLLHCDGVSDDEDAQVLFAAVPANETTNPTARALRRCGPQTVAVLLACAAPGTSVTADDLAGALDQTVVYAVDSIGSAIRSSSAEDANDEWLGSTRTV